MTLTLQISCFESSDYIFKRCQNTAFMISCPMRPKDLLFSPKLQQYLFGYYIRILFLTFYSFLDVFYIVLAGLLFELQIISAFIE